MYEPPLLHGKAVQRMECVRLPAFRPYLIQKPKFDPLWVDLAPWRFFARGSESVAANPRRDHYRRMAEHRSIGTAGTTAFVLRLGRSKAA